MKFKDLFKKIIKQKETHEPVVETKKSKGRLTDQERIAKYDEEIAKHLQIIEVIKAKKEALGDKQIKALAKKFKHDELIEAIKKLDEKEEEIKNDKH